MDRQDNYVDKVSREINIVGGGMAQGALDEAWKRAQNPASLCGTVAKDVIVGAVTAAAITFAPEVVFPLLACGTSAILLEDRSGEKKVWQASERMFAACQSAWNNPAQEVDAKNVIANELGKPVFDGILGGIAMVPGLSIGTKFAEGKLAQMAESALANKTMYMTNLGEGTLQTRIGQSLVTTKADGTVIKQFDNGLIQRHIPTESGDYIFTELRPNGVLTMTLPEGTRMVELPSGRLYTFEPNGSYEVERQTGLRMSSNANETVRTFTHPNGVVTRFDGTNKERFLPAK